MADDTRTPGAIARDMWSNSRVFTDSAIDRLLALDETADMRLVTKLAAIVAANSNRELGDATIVAAESISFRLEQLDDSTSALTAATKASTKGLTRWTKVMAFATLALVLTSLAQIYVARQTKPPQIVVMPAAAAKP